MELPKKWSQLVGEKLLKKCVEKIPENPVPRRELIFKCFTYFDPEDCQVVILGQDPYPSVEAAEGLSFSCSGRRQSITRIFKSLILQNYMEEAPADSHLDIWAEKGVLLLNSMLTYSPNKDTYWWDFTDAILQNLFMVNLNVVVFAWGQDAQKRTENLPRDRVFRYVHPASRQSIWNFQDFDKAPPLFLKISGYSLKKYIRVYTDGACKNNGKSWARGGWACVFHCGFAKSAFLEMWGRLPESEISFTENLKILKNKPAAATNNRAEMFAIIVALYKIFTLYGPATVEIITDSNFTINVCTDWMHKWYPNFGEKKNPDMTAALYNICAKHTLIFTHQEAHLKDPKTPNEIGNARADFLAVQGRESETFKTSSRINLLEK
jgi:uracil-DNA glycosylase